MANMNNQGKTPQQYKDSLKFFSRAMLGFILLMILMVLFGGCATTHETSKECCKSKTISTE